MTQPNSLPAGLPPPGPYTATAAQASDLLARLAPTDMQALRRTVGWIVMVALLDALLTATGLIPTLSSTAVFLFLPLEARESALEFWAPGRMTGAELTVVAVLLSLLAIGAVLLHGSDRALWQTPLTARETRTEWVLALRLAMVVYLLLLALQVAGFRSPLSFPLAGRVLGGIAAAVVFIHLIQRVRTLTTTHPRLHGSLVGAALAAFGVQSLSAVAAQLYDLTEPYPTALGELKVLQLACGFIGGAYLTVYTYFAAMTPAPAQHTETTDPNATPMLGTSGGGTVEDWRSESYIVTIIPNCEPSNTISPPPGGGLPPVRGTIAYEAKDHLFAFREDRGSYVRCPWNWMALSRYPHLLIDTDALRRTRSADVEFGDDGEWLRGKVRWQLILPAESVPDRMPVVAWQVLRQVLTDPQLTNKLSVALDNRFGRFLSVFETADGVPLGRNPDLIAARLREQLALSTGAAYLDNPGGTLIERCTALAAVRQERMAIRGILSAIDRTESSVLKMAAGVGSAFAATSLLEALPRGTLNAVPEGQRLAVRGFLERFLIDVTGGAGRDRARLTTKAMDVLTAAREPLTENLKQLRDQYDAQVVIFKKQLGAARNDAKAIRDCRLRIEELVVTGVFDKDNVAPVLAHLSPDEARDMVLRHSMFFGQTLPPARDPELDELDGTDGPDSSF